MLKTIFSKSHLKFSVSQDVEVRGLSYDSRSVAKGDLYFAMQGVYADGHDFLAQAAKQGAVAAVVQREVGCPIPIFKSDMILSDMSKISNVFFDEPSKKIPIIGITGTNGKTTTTYIIEAILKSAGKTCGVIGTVNYRLGGDVRSAPNTTPLSLDVQHFLSEAVSTKADAVVMEVSSHALEQHRVNDVTFTVGVFTNLTQDHLDFHGTMERYFEAKQKLFKRREKLKAVINIDDSYGRRLAGMIPGALTFGQSPDAKVRAMDVTCNLSGIHFKLAMPSGKTYEVSNNLLGFHNVSNCLAAVGAMSSLGLAEEWIVQGLNQTLAVPGRLERVEAGQGFVVAVDYAHTHDALEQVLGTLRNTGPKRLFCVFGAGGDRDKTKRPKMGVVAVRLADHVFVTSDNPRSEDPKMILKDIEDGIQKTGKTNYEIIEDREQAIRKAIHAARAGDIILIAGKGHETYQIYGNKKNHFSDFEVATKALSE